MYLEDGSLCRSNDIGELVFISAADRNELND